MYTEVCILPPVRHETCGLHSECQSCTTYLRVQEPLQVIIGGVYLSPDSVSSASSVQCSSLKLYFVSNLLFLLPSDKAVPGPTPIIFDISLLLPYQTIDLSDSSDPRSSVVATPILLEFTWRRINLKPTLTLMADLVDDYGSGSSWLSAHYFQKGDALGQHLNLSTVLHIP